ncbi:MAG: hypothetical protein A2806_02645 [Candidatus Terrybacteria bacterium RIFCSPHIGHO2_01_FULL_48_17]|uniref:DUF2231 domain-containing protein n=1 Tax=Candidatus Terrybacteria bacterium RIFCSPHIGHO2_01_FULL_48_17 TaxID=1802362 RepID=A0A1G2PHY0_9BACT|nr:MAG: hypothetical protein A2806_02645 [Candidatus Terrybacteria bacterium RIFCSPHIGHO2_01_FULL_48_17]
MNFPELLSSVHGTIATFLLMGFTGAFAELVEITHAGVKRIQWGVGVMTTAAILLVSSGLWAYIFYRAPIPESPRSILKAGPTPWVHEVLFELKEHIGTYVPAVMLVAFYLVFVHGSELQQNRPLRMLAAGLLLLALVWTFMTFGLGVYVTKQAAL